MNYYRLKQIDFDGGFEYSDIIIVEMTRDDNKGISLFPNPTIGIANISIDTDQEGEGVINVYDVMGKIVKTQQIVLEGGLFTTTIEVSDLAAGTYTVSVETKQAQWQQRLIVE